MPAFSTSSSTPVLGQYILPPAFEGREGNVEVEKLRILVAFSLYYLGLSITVEESSTHCSSIGVGRLSDMGTWERR